MTNKGPSMVLGSVQWGLERYPLLYLWVDGSYSTVPLHRLTAYVHGLIDHIRFAEDSREVHHVDGDKWNNDPENLEALEPEAHGRVTRGVADD